MSAEAARGITGTALTGALRGSDHSPQPLFHVAIVRIIKQHLASDIDRVAAGRPCRLTRC